MSSNEDGTSDPDTNLLPKENSTTVQNVVGDLELQSHSHSKVLKLDPSYSWLNYLKEDRENKVDDDEDTISTDSLSMPTPPDGGWGWFVLLGSFMINVIVDGVSYSFGILYAELLVQFGSSRGMMSLLGSIYLGVSLMLGPFASSLIDRFGCRTMTMCGGIIAAIGLILSSFAQSVEMLCFTFGVVVGVGFSPLYITSIAVVAFYFKKRRSFATGLSFCGTGVGTFVFAPLVELLISEFGWRGMFLILSGISLNLVACGMLFRPLKFTEDERKQQLRKKFEQIPHGQERIEVVNSLHQDCASEQVEGLSEDSHHAALSALNIPTFVEQSNLKVSNKTLFDAIRNGMNPDRTSNRIIKAASGQHGHLVEEVHCDEELSDKCYYQINNGGCHSKMNSNDHTDIEFQSTVPLTNGSVHNGNLSNHGFHCKSDSDTFCSGPKDIPENGHSDLIDHAHIRRRPRGLGICYPLYRNDIFYRINKISDGSSSHLVLSTSCPELQVEYTHAHTNSKVPSVFKEIKSIIKSTFSVKLLKIPFLLIFLVSNFLFYFWSDIPYMYAADHAMHNGIDSRRASFLISAIGISNTLGQLVFGYIGDLKVNILNVYAIVSVLAGVSIVLLPLMPSYWSACLMYACFGFFVSVSFPLTTILVVKYLGIENLTNAEGLLLLVQGTANLFGPPVAGWVSDMSGTYNAAFYLAGLFHALSGITLFLVYIPSFKALPVTKKTIVKTSTDDEKV